MFSRIRRTSPIRRILETKFSLGKNFKNPIISPHYSPPFPPWTHHKVITTVAVNHISLAQRWCREEPVLYKNAYNIKQLQSLVLRAFLTTINGYR